MHAISATHPGPQRARTAMVHETVPVFAFIYVVRPIAAERAAAERRYCTVLALGSSVRQAEAIAINCVHQYGWHILRADTATALDVNDVAEFRDGRAVLGELDQFGVSLRCASPEDDS